ncbi:uncharacterized protein LOC116123373 [Pistacia vera]|uniref:uncharacterized protein LOC116123373 n=1 Tax=Pistacia vera TaxID=55513 RepID=UPI001263CEF9|nr:uncharacterized protein LOC116123373 [Pistacia vera]
MHEEEASKAPRALSHIHSAVTDLVFTRIMACEIARNPGQVREEFMGSSTTRNMQVLNLRREFESLRMQEAEKVKEYVDRLMSIVNKIRLLGVEMLDSRIVEKVMVSLPEKHKSKRRVLRLEDANMKGQCWQPTKANLCKGIIGSLLGKKRKRKVQQPMEQKLVGCEIFQPVLIAKERTLQRQMLVQTWYQCRAYKQFGHIERVCRNKGELPTASSTADETTECRETEQLFMAYPT